MARLAQGMCEQGLLVELEDLLDRRENSEPVTLHLTSEELTQLTQRQWSKAKPAQTTVSADAPRPAVGEELPVVHQHAEKVGKDNWVTQAIGSHSNVASLFVDSVADLQLAKGGDGVKELVVTGDTWDFLLGEMVQETGATGGGGTSETNSIELVRYKRSCQGIG